MYALVGWYPAPSQALGADAAGNPSQGHARPPRPAPAARRARPRAVLASPRACAVPLSMNPAP